MELSVKLDQELLTYRVFDNIVQELFAFWKTDVPTAAEDIEDAILDHLPVKCSFNVGSGTNANIITAISFEN